MEAAHKIFRTLDALKDGDQAIWSSPPNSTDAPDTSFSAWHVQGAAPGGRGEYPQIKRLFLQDCLSLRSFDILASFPNLETLWVYGSDKITSLDGLPLARRLHSVTIWPSMGASITVDSLSPAGALTGLRELVFAGRARDGSLAPLHGLGQLRTVFLSNAYAWQEFARFEACQPAVDFPWKGGITPAANPGVLTCKTCAAPQSLLTGKGLRLACPHCDAATIAKHLERYRRLRGLGA